MGYMESTQMTWTFEQSTGRLIDPDGNVAASGYAGGNCGNNPEGKNNPNLQHEHSVGPLPAGVYTFTQYVDHAHLGPFTILLEPDPDNEMFGRSAFRMHGDSMSHPGCASEGCIIMPRHVREAVFASDDHTITVVRGGDAA
jgi:hypothetical protein